MATMRRLAFVLGLAYALAFSLTIRAQQPSGDGPRYTNGNNLVRPTNYREWIFLSSGLGMSYDPPVGNPPAGSPAGPGFGNVFVNPSAYRAFLQTGAWPDGTVFILEGRRSSSEGSINKAGRFQTELAGIEAEVKDARFPDGWAFFAFGRGAAMKDAVAPLAGTAVASCVDCHSKNAAVERSFVQFYPTLLEVARQKRTLKPGF